MHIYRLPAQVLNAHLSGRLIVGFIANVITTHMRIASAFIKSSYANANCNGYVCVPVCVCVCVCQYTCINIQFYWRRHLTLSLSERHATATVCGDFGISFTVRKLKLKFAGAAPTKPIIL